MSYSISPRDLKGTIVVEQETDRLDTPSKIDVKAPTSDAPATPQSTPTAPEQKASDPRLEDLERKEIALRETARKIAAEKAELESLRAASKTPPPGMMTAEQWREQFMADPTKLGIGYQEMADKYLTQPSEQDQKYQALQAKIAELEGRLGEGSKAMEEAQKRAFDNAVNQMKAETARIIESSPQDFELISAQGQHGAVVELITRTYQEDGVLMSPKEAAEKVEAFLLDRALKVAGLRKVREKTSPPVAETAEKKTDQSQTQTLSQSMQASRPLTPRERAIAAFNRKLS